MRATMRIYIHAYTYMYTIGTILYVIFENIKMVYRTEYTVIFTRSCKRMSYNLIMYHNARSSTKHYINHYMYLQEALCQGPFASIEASLTLQAFGTAHILTVKTGKRNY